MRYKNQRMGISLFILCSTFLISFLSCRPAGQPAVAQWAKSPSAGTEASQFFGVAVSPDGSVVVAGAIAGQEEFEFGSAKVRGVYAGTNGILVKYDASGSVLWAKTASLAFADSIFHSVAIAADGSIYVVGEIRGNLDFDFGNSVRIRGSSAGGNAILVKYSNYGEAQWARSTISGEDDSVYYRTAVAADGSVYTTGTVTGKSIFSFGDTATVTGAVVGKSILIVKYDSRGTAVWAKSAASTSHDSEFYGLAVTADGSVYAAGWTSLNDEADFFKLGESHEANGAYKVGDNALLVKYDSIGNVVWARTTTEATSHSNFFGVATDADGSAYVIGGVSGDQVFGFGDAVFVKGKSKTAATILAKYSSEGVPLWVKPVQSETDLAMLTGISVSGSNSIYVAGMAGGLTTYDFGNGVKVAGVVDGYNLLLARLDTEGNASWAMTASAAEAGSLFTGATAGADGSVYAVGSFTGIVSIGVGNSVQANGLSGTENGLIVKYKEAEK